MGRVVRIWIGWREGVTRLVCDVAQIEVDLF